MPLPSTPEPRQRRRWPWILLALLLAFFGTVGWRVFTERRAIRQLEEAGLMLQERPSMWSRARSDWRSLLNPDLWKESLGRRVIAKWDEPSLRKVERLRNFDALAAALGRLNPDSIVIYYGRPSSLENVDGLRGLTALTFVGLSDCTALRNLAGLQGLTQLRILHLVNCRALPNFDGLTGLEDLALTGCTELHNADALKGLTNLRSLVLETCPELENVDALKGLTKLKSINVTTCPKLSKESIAALRAALPNTAIPGKDENRAR